MQFSRSDDEVVRSMSPAEAAEALGRPISSVYARRSKLGITLGARRVADRLWAKVEKTKSGCWEWLGAIRHDGYGVIKHGGKFRRVHRIAWEISRGDVPDGMFICHRCDNRKCINPEHLFIGSPKDNTSDMMSKSRNRCSAPKLDADDAIAIFRSTGSAPQVARRFGVCPSAVNLIRRKKRWARVIENATSEVQ